MKIQFCDILLIIRVSPWCQWSLHYHSEYRLGRNVVVRISCFFFQEIFKLFIFFVHFQDKVAEIQGETWIWGYVKLLRSDLLPPPPPNRPSGSASGNTGRSRTIQEWQEGITFGSQVGNNFNFLPEMVVSLESFQEFKALHDRHWGNAMF